MYGDGDVADPSMIEKWVMVDRKDGSQHFNPSSTKVNVLHDFVFLPPVSPQRIDLKVML